MHIPITSYYDKLVNFPVKEVDEGKWYIFHFGGNNKLRSLETVGKVLNDARRPHHMWMPAKQILVYKQSNIVPMYEPIFYDYAFVNMSFDWDIYANLKKEVSNFSILQRSKTEEPYHLTSETMHDLRDVYKRIDTSSTCNEMSIKNFKYRVNDCVNITYGPFANMVGKVQEVNKNQVVLLISFFGKEVKFFVPIEKSHYMVATLT